ncbi:MAG: protein kinase [Firmicutes bacterium]|nr:protein kinase [Bacillota bacterium]
MSKYCFDCGYVNDDAVAKCVYCGSSLEHDEKDESADSDGENAFADKKLLNKRYEILSEIKSGAMGSVYKGYDCLIGKNVAIKKLNPHQSDMEFDETVEAFRREAHILSELKHRGIPRVFDFFTDKDPDTDIPACWMVMTYVSGEDLESYLQKQELPLSDIWVKNLLLRLLDILKYLHSRTPPIIYRDIKPSNIMLAEKGVFLVDFGIARVMNRNRKGTQIGTPGYAPPEQYKGYADEKSDIYALGVLAHYLLTGKNPENSQNPFTFKSIYNVNPAVDMELSKLIDSMLEVLPDKRPENVDEIYDYISRKVAFDPDFPGLRSEYAQMTQNGSLKYGSWLAGIIGGLYLLSLGSCLVSIGMERHISKPLPQSNYYNEQESEAIEAMQVAEKLYNEKKYSQAVEKYEFPADAFLRDYRLYLHRGKSYMELGEPEKAFEDLKKTLEIKPDCAEAHFYMALIKKDENPFFALGELNEALNYNPDLKEARIMHAEFLKKKGEYDQADADYLIIYGNDKDKSKYQSKLAETAFLRKDYDKALDLINSAINISLSVKSYHILKNKILEASGNKAKT